MNYICKAAQSTHRLADIMGNMQANRQTTMNQEPTAKRSRKDQDTISAAVDGLTNGMVQSAEDQYCATAELQRGDRYSSILMISRRIWCFGAK